MKQLIFTALCCLSFGVRAGASPSGSVLEAAAESRVSFAKVYDGDAAEKSLEAVLPASLSRALPVSLAPAQNGGGSKGPTPPEKT